ncbi:hypothetical protein MRF4_21630 [Methylobacterium radiotolerans]|uniref:bifunctional DNA primase/polymerase n=1 Tax=Methylobacterium TaxID=407 RepID=UPI002F31EE27
MNMITPTTACNLISAEAAKIYLGLGMELLAVHPLSKAPVGNEWQTRPGVTDPDHARLEFLDPAQNIGFKPGDRFAVIDIDTKNGGKGAQSFAELNERLGPLPDTVEAVTASGGGMRIYRLPPEVDLEFQKKMLGLPDLEFRVGAINCLLPPSRVRYPDGTIGQHRWKAGRGAGEFEVAELPPILIEALRAYEPEKSAVGGDGAVAEYLSADLKTQLPAEPTQAEFAPIRAGCAFIAAADERPGDVGEEAWYAVLSITSRCRDGEKISHLISEGHPDYVRQKTDQKMVQAYRASGPRTCANIRNKLGFKGCERCPFWSRIKSPILLGKLPPKPRDPRTKEVTPYELLKRVKLQASMVYDGHTDQVFRPGSGEVVKAKTFAAMVRARVGRNPIDTMLSWEVTPRVARLDYLPGDTRLVLDQTDALPRCNTWQPGGAVAREDGAAAARIMNHFETLFPDETTRRYVLDYVAHLIQYPGVKIKNTLMITGGEGFGKSTIGVLLEALFGKRNARTVGGKQLSSRFKDSLVDCQVLVVEEANHGERFEVTEDLKQWFTGEEFPVEGKGITFYDGRTPRGILIFSNHDAPLVVGPGSRRFFVGATTREKPNPAYFAEIYAAIEDEAVVGAFKHLLLTRDISRFNPHAEPPRTGAREEAERASRTPLGTIFAQMIEEETGVFYRDVILIREAEEALAPMRAIGRAEYVNTNKVVAALKQVGAQQVGVNPDGKHRLITMPDGTKARLWAVRNPARWREASDKELKAEVARLPPGVDTSKVRPLWPEATKEEASETKAG